MTKEEQLIEELSKMPPMVIATAYLHAINYTLYGEDVTKAWLSATQQASILEKSYTKGYYDALQSKWIPVSSKNLPKLHKKVLISTTDGKVNKVYRRHKEWTENQYEWVVHEMLGYSYTYTDDEVLAWQPLPESYKPENEKPIDNTDKDTLPPIIW